MAYSRVILLYSHPLISESIQQVVPEAVFICRKITRPDTLRWLTRQDADAVLIAVDEDSAAVKHLVASIQERRPDLPILLVSLSQNVIRQYTSQTIPARSSDLIDAIHRLSTYPNRNMSQDISRSTPDIEPAKEREKNEEKKEP